MWCEVGWNAGSGAATRNEGEVKMSVYRPTIIRYVLNGKRATKATPGARAKREKSDTYWGRIPLANGKRKPVALCDDKEAAEAMLAAMLSRAKREARGDIDPFEDHRTRPIAEHLEDFRGYLDSKGNTSEYVELTVNRIEAAFVGCRFEKLADLNAGKVGNWLADRRKPKKNSKGDVVPGLGVASSNHYLTAAKAFGAWLVKDRRSPENPFAHLSRMNAKVDVRVERHVSSADGLARVIEAAERSEKVFRGLDGSTRAILYRLAAMTGLRVNELASLTPASFDLAAEPPTVTVQAGYSKRRRRDVLPLHQDLAARLRQWFLERKHEADAQQVILSLDRASEAKYERLFPGTWVKKAAMMLRIDLGAAGIEYEHDDGTADFHALRHSFISNLATGGVHPKVAQQLARHSTISLTMDRYTHLAVLDMTAGLEALPTIARTESVASRATGTLDEVGVSFGCTNGCTRPAEITHFQPKSPVSLTTSETSSRETKKPHLPAGNEAFRETDDSEASVGVEPTRDGFAIRCLSHLATTPE